MNKLFAIYRGDTFLFVGDTVDECAKFSNVKKNVIHHYCTPAHHKRSTDEAIKIFKYEV